MWRKHFSYYLLILVPAFSLFSIADGTLFSGDKITSGDTAPPTPPSVQLKIGGERQPRLIKKITPLYPDLAKRARVEGSVILAVNIDEDGNVSDIKVQSGHPLLNDAAIDAVKQWKYTPILLSGEPVPEMAAVTVVFSFGEPGLFHPRIDLVVAKVIADLKAGRSADDKAFIRERKAEVELSVTSRSKEVMAKLQSLGFEVISLQKESMPIVGRIAVEKLALLLDIDAVNYIAPHRR
jgi:TonB family protein